MKKFMLFWTLALMICTVVPSFVACENEDDDIIKVPQITLTTSKKLGETIVLRFRETNMPTEVIGAKMINEEFIDMDGGHFEAGVVDVTYTLTSQTVIIKGDITGLRCWYNGLTALDVSRCPGLTLLQCDENQLTTLNVSKNPALEFLTCTSNQLAKLDVSKNTKLEYLTCDSNNLTTINISKNTKLVIFSCSNNKLTSLDVSKNVTLYSFDCCRNKIKAAEMSKIINTLPDWTDKQVGWPWRDPSGHATLYVISNSSPEENEISEADIKIAEQKNWELVSY